MPILTAKVGTNKDLVLDISELYLKPDNIVLDVTHGRGIFWKDIDTSQYQFFPSDITTGVDFRHLPYQSSWGDVIVLDPPYIYNPSKTIKKSIAGVYNINGRVDISTNEKVLNLYYEGMVEAYRVLKVGGYLFVKCQDVIQSNVQCWNHISIFNVALEQGFYGKDLFVLVQSTIPAMRWKHQKHARKNHSYLWVFEKKIETPHHKL